MKDETKTFTKSILSIVMLLYFMGAILGTVLVIINTAYTMRMGLAIDPQFYIAYATYLGGPTATAIAFYAWKSKAENLLKIHYGNASKTNKEPPDISVLANMGGNT